MIKTRPGQLWSQKRSRRTRKLINEGLLTEEDAYHIHVEIPEKLYNVEMDL
jgi:TatD-related deoxyribonuclease